MSNANIPAGATCNYTVTVTSSTLGSYPDATGALTTPISLNTAGATATLTVSGGPGSPPALQSGKSRKPHGATSFDLPL